MYNTDRPIDNVKKDLLGRASFSKQLSKALYYYSGDDSLVVGLFGKWGSGKTSVIIMALQTMDEELVKERDGQYFRLWSTQAQYYQSN